MHGTALHVEKVFQNDTLSTNLCFCVVNALFVSQFAINVFPNDIELVLYEISIGCKSKILRFYFISKGDK